MRLLQRLLTALLLCSLVHGQGDEELLRQLEKDLVAARMWDRPGWALQNGASGPIDVIAPLLSPTRNPEWRRRIGALELGLSRVHQRQLDPLYRARAEALGATLQAERILLDTRSSERWHAVGYAGRMQRTLLGLTRMPPSEDSGEALRSILEQLPNYWSNARTSLVAPILTWNLLGAERVDAIRELLSREAESDRSKAWGKDMRARWELILEQASKKTTEFESWLGEQPSRAGSPPPRLGAERWQELAQAATGSPLEWHKMKWAAFSFLAEMEEQHGAYWRAEERPKPVADALLQASGVAPALNAFLQTTGLMGELRVPSVRTRFSKRSPGGPRADAIFVLRLPRRVSLYLDPELEQSDAATITALTVAQTLPMAWLTGDAAFTQSRAMFDGWKLYALDWPLRVDWVENPLSAIPDYAAAAAHLQVIESARFLASAELHAEGLTQVEASERFKQRTGLGLARALREVQAITLDPRRGLGFLAWRELRAFEAHLGQGEAALAQSIRFTTIRPQLRPHDLQTSISR